MIKNKIMQKVTQKGPSLMGQKGLSPMGQILNVFFPPVCGICEKLSPRSLCNKCKKHIQNQVIYGVEDYKNTSSFFDEHIYLFRYSGEVRNAMLNYKFQEKAYIYTTFFDFFKNSEKIIVQIKKYDIIIPVPISKKRFKQRGYNQSEIFAREMAKFLKMDFDEKVLIKIKDNNAQSKLSMEERIKNVHDVYRIKNKQKIYNKKILIVDDIFTTGNTVNECAKLLIESSAKSVGIFTIAKD